MKITKTDELSNQEVFSTKKTPLAPVPDNPTSSRPLCLPRRQHRSRQAMLAAWAYVGHGSKHDHLNPPEKRQSHKTRKTRQCMPIFAYPITPIIAQWLVLLPSHLLPALQFPGWGLFRQVRGQVQRSRAGACAFRLSGGTRQGRRAGRGRGCVYVNAWR